MHYLIYKITNRLNNKFYVGKHKTENKDDGYFGSGILIERAIAKHGKENFVKEILFELPTEDAMNQKEADIVDEDFVARDDTYNIKLGGDGGFDYINSTRKNIYPNHNRTDAFRRAASLATKQHFSELSEEERAAMRLKNSIGVKRWQIINGNPFQGKHHTDESRNKMRKAKIGLFDGKKNPAYGKHWITNGTENRMSRDIPIGWRLGRV